ncbi:hypothetical protein Q1695_000628 [Nippostrongylus brasiliensis]|nr:hypothetical protein Q1695_000628 [Nippostrongylus brasiliensis]
MEVKAYEQEILKFFGCCLKGGRKRPRSRTIPPSAVPQEKVRVIFIQDEFDRDDDDDDVIVDCIVRPIKHAPHQPIPFVLARQRVSHQPLPVVTAPSQPVAQPSLRGGRHEQHHCPALMMPQQPNGARRDPVWEEHCYFNPDQPSEQAASHQIPSTLSPGAQAVPGGVQDNSAEQPRLDPREHNHPALEEPNGQASVHQNPSNLLSSAQTVAVRAQENFDEQGRPVPREPRHPVPNQADLQADEKHIQPDRDRNSEADSETSQGNPAHQVRPVRREHHQPVPNVPNRQGTDQRRQPEQNDQIDSSERENQPPPAPRQQVDSNQVQRPARQNGRGLAANLPNDALVLRQQLRDNSSRQNLQPERQPVSNRNSQPVLQARQPVAVQQNQGVVRQQLQHDRDGNMEDDDVVIIEHNQNQVHVRSLLRRYGFDAYFISRPMDVLRVPDHGMIYVVDNRRIECFLRVRTVPLRRMNYEQQIIFFDRLRARVFSTEPHVVAAREANQADDDEVQIVAVVEPDNSAAAVAPAENIQGMLQLLLLHLRTLRLAAQIVTVSELNIGSNVPQTSAESNIEGVASSMDTSDFEKQVLEASGQQSSGADIDVDFFCNDKHGKYANVVDSDLSSGPPSSDDDNDDDDDDEYICDEEEDIDDVPEEYTDEPKSIKNRVRQSRETDETAGCVSRKRKRFSTFVDDSDDLAFEKRIRRLRALDRSPEEVTYKDIGHDMKLSREVWDRLFRYQKEGVLWLMERQRQYSGGILADEMGLGKTVQVLAFLRALDESQIEDAYFEFTGLGPSIIVCPSTLLRQWVIEIRTWMPYCRVAQLHSSGNHKGSRRGLIKKMAVNRRGGSILITTYNTFYINRHEITSEKWHYVILDEGHKIRTPKAQITTALKSIRTPCRIILSGTPLQNSLTEIWSLIDFIEPGLLSTIALFKDRFVGPISRGAYANATQQQQEAAYKCAEILRNAISPLILRRLKKNVEKVLHLPAKNEKVLFCDLSPEQCRFYSEFINSRRCERILSGKLDAWTGLVVLRKLCNHPDLVTGGPKYYEKLDGEKEDRSKAYGYYRRSGKMITLMKLLHLWHAEGNHKVLLFSQSKKMLSIIELKLQEENYAYLRMDGESTIAKRQRMIQEFNEDPNIFVFLLTTRVGGLGLNLTSANNVVIFDPDWNPSTDTQAKERVWRIGQQRVVTIYRLVSVGTIEEKIYQRQIYKEFLANRVLKNPKQRRFFTARDLHDLFSFVDVSRDCPTETGTIFASETNEIRKENFFDSHLDEKRSRKKKKHKKKDEGDDVVDVALSEAKRAELRERARRLARKLSMETAEKSNIGDQPPNEDRRDEVSSKTISIGKTEERPSEVQAADGLVGQIEASRSEKSESHGSAKNPSSLESNMKNIEDVPSLEKPSTSHSTTSPDGAGDPQEQMLRQSCATKSCEVGDNTASPSRTRPESPEMSLLREQYKTIKMKRKPSGKAEANSSDDFVNECNLTERRSSNASVKSRKHSKSDDNKKKSHSKKRKLDSSPTTPQEAEGSRDNLDEDYVLGCLLKSAGVRCALSHDDLIGEKTSELIVGREAREIARQASNAISKVSNKAFVREFCAKREVLVGSPFAGKHRQEGLADSTISAIKERKKKAAEKAAGGVHANAKDVDLAQRLREYFLKHDGRAYTEQISKAFEKDFNKNKVLLRATLQRLALNDRLRRQWFLKKEYM